MQPRPEEKMKPEKYSFTHDERGLTSLMSRTLSLRRAGFKTFARTETVAHFPLYVLTAIPAPRLNRQARGCDIRVPA